MKKTISILLLLVAGHVEASVDCIFQARRTAYTIVTNTAWSNITFQIVGFDHLKGWNTTNSIYTVQTNGFYKFELNSLTLQPYVAGGAVNVKYVVPFKAFAMEIYPSVTGVSYQSISVNMPWVELTNGSTIRLQGIASGNRAVYIGTGMDWECVLQGYYYSTNAVTSGTNGVIDVESTNEILISLGNNQLVMLAVIGGIALCVLFVMYRKPW